MFHFTRNMRSQGCHILAAVLCALILASGWSGKALAAGTDETARPSRNGRLHVEGTQLVDESGQAVQLRGVSTHGLTWYPEYINEGLFRQVSEDWNCNFIRLAMYASIYCEGGREESLAMLRKGIDAAVASDMYVLVDWHMLEKGNPNDQLPEAMEFFDGITKEYADCPNLIFEICNEPNGPINWGHVVDYSNQVIPVIRKNIPDAVIVIGTPEYDQNLAGAVLRPLNFDNIMYVLHFYAASHTDGLRTELSSAVEAGLPVLISECGICEASGDGRIDFASAATWFRYLDEHKISYAIWSLSDKDESSAFFRPGFNPHGTIRDSDLTASGLWVRELIRGNNPETIPAPAASVEKGTVAKIRSWIGASLGTSGLMGAALWTRFAGVAATVLLGGTLLFTLYGRGRRKRRLTYGDIVGPDLSGSKAAKQRRKNNSKKESEWTKKESPLAKPSLILSLYFTLIYLGWRVVCSIPTQAGALAVTANLVLLAVEVLGFVESMVLYRSFLGLRDYPLPHIPIEAWPEVDVFIATYNEPVELLRRTINGCKHMRYPDSGKVHVWLCDDSRRPQMRELAEKMGVGYFDRPDNKGAKAGNLNHALERTSAPYVVTFDADMIPRSDFLMKTIPFFVDVELREEQKPESERLHLGLLQTPQSFYTPDVFQYGLYSEKQAPNEQDFFYRTIEPAKTATNSVIYGGSNTVLSRRALEAVGGFFTGSITEDFATGLLIESAGGYVSLALPEPLASGQTPQTFADHIKQRNRWGRGVIATAKKLKIWRRKNLTFGQKFSYWSSVFYWYSPIKSLVYILSPLLYAVFGIPVFRCNWLEMLIFWLPMFFLQDLCLRLNSGRAISNRWSGIYQTCVMPYMLLPILQESMGISVSVFAVTDKSGVGGKRKLDLRAMCPYLVLSALSVAAIVRIILMYEVMQTVNLLILLFWIVRNLYYLIMAMFLIDGRDGDKEQIRVKGSELVTLQSGEVMYKGVTTQLTEHNLTIFLSEGQELTIGTHVTVSILCIYEDVVLQGIVTGIRESRNKADKTYTIEILDYGEDDSEYLQLLYDRVPSLPQSLEWDFGALSHLWQNIACRVALTRK